MLNPVTSDPGQKCSTRQKKPSEKPTVEKYVYIIYWFYYNPKAYNPAGFNIREATKLSIHSNRVSVLIMMYVCVWLYAGGCWDCDVGEDDDP